MPEINVPLEELRKRKIFFATPMFGGMCAGLFTRSAADLSAYCTHYQIGLQYYFLFNESLIQRARNYCCDEFLRSDCTHLMFVDADIGFDAKDILALLALSSDESPYDIIGGPYPKKCISWEKIVQAVNKGLADQNPNELENFVGDYVFNPTANTTSIKLDEPCEVSELGTGFMMIKRATLEKFRDAFPWKMYRPDHIRTEFFDGSREICAFFGVDIDHGRDEGKMIKLIEEIKENHNNPEKVKSLIDNLQASMYNPNASKRLLSEDYQLCYDLQKLGLKTWLCPWIKLNHVGSYVFGGSLMHLAAAGCAATADPQALGKTQKNHKKN